MAPNGIRRLVRPDDSPTEWLTVRSVRLQPDPQEPEA